MSNATNITKALETLARDRGTDLWELVPVFGIELGDGTPEPVIYDESELEDAKTVARMLTRRGRQVTLRRVVTRATYRADDCDASAGRNVALGFCPDGCCAHEEAHEEGAKEGERVRRVLAAFRTIGAKGAARFAR